MKRVALLAVLAGASIIPSFADVTLTVGDHVKVTAINGQAITQSPFQPLKKQFTLQAGQQVITAKYDRLYDLRSDEHDYLRSDNVTVTANLADNQTYTLAMLNQPEKYDQAKEYAKAPTLAILSGDTVVSQQTAEAKTGGLFSSIGAMFGRGDSAVVENQKVISAVQQTQPAQASQATQPAQAQRPSNTLDSFMQLWLNASDEEREKIRQWVGQ